MESLEHLIKKINKLSEVICCLENNSINTNIIDIINIENNSPNIILHNTVQVKNNGEVYFVDKDGDVQQIEFIQKGIIPSTVNSLLGTSILLNGTTYEIGLNIKDLDGQDIGANCDTKIPAYDSILDKNYGVLATDIASTIIENPLAHTPISAGNIVGRAKFVKPDNTQAYYETNKDYFIDLCGNSIKLDTYHGNIFYVSKEKPDKVYGVQVRGLSIADLNNLSFDYENQLRSAAVGSMKHTYPCPWSARNAALDAIATGKITEAVIVVLPGNTYTIGSEESSKNGSIDGSAANSDVEAEIKFNVADNTTTASLIMPKISIHFGVGCELHYINSSYNIFFGYHQDLTDTVVNLNITGNGRFKQWYGQASGFSAELIRIDNANATLNFEADFVQLNYRIGVDFRNIGKFNIKIKDFKTGYTTMLLYSGDRESAREVNGVFEIDNLLYGNNVLGNAVDYWSAFFLNSMTTTKKNFVIKIKNADTTMGSPQYDNFNGGCPVSSKNMHTTFKCNNFIQKEDTYSIGLMSSTSIFGRTYDGSENCTFNVDIKYAETTAALFGIFKLNNVNGGVRHNLNCDLHIKKPTASSIKANIWCDMNYLSSGGILCGKQVITGTYINSEGEVIYMTDGWANKTRLHEFKGAYITKAAGKPVVQLSTHATKQFIFTDAMLINDGITPCIKAISGSIDTYFKNVHANSPVDNVTINQVGETVTVNSELLKYTY